MIRTLFDRAGAGWSGLLLLALVGLPWFKGGPFTSSALVEGLAGRAWLLPLIAVAAVLVGLSLSGRGWRQHRLALVLCVAGLAWLGLQGFGIGLRGPAFPALGALFPQAAAGQPGFGWGGYLAAVALVGLLADVLAARGFCRGERFAAFSVIFIVAALSLFVFFPILKLISAAFVAPEGAVSVMPFLSRVTAPDLWSLGCATGQGAAAW